MFNIDKEQYELIEMREKSSETIDTLLDYFNKYPKECEQLLSEMVHINKELDELDEELKNLKNEISICNF
jgi:uncharacterized coiled-coil DUF342 family protein